MSHGAGLPFDSPHGRFIVDSPCREIEACKKYPLQRVFISSEIRELRDAKTVGLD